MFPCARTLSIAIFALFSFSIPANAKDFKISTFNVEWYGLGGNMNGKAADEKRDANLKALVTKSLQGSDVIVFQEVIDVKRLESKVVPSGWNCKTYPHSEKLHQHVVACVDPTLKLMREPSDNNDIIDEVADIGGKARPALHFIVADQKNTPLFRIIGVHLKAFPQEFKKRENQAKAIATYLKKLNSDLPVILTGDFNTFDSKETGNRVDDATLLSATLEKAKLTEVSGEFNTYKTLKHANHFDRFWVSDSLLVGDLHVLKYCQLDEQLPADAKKITWYNENISDHCPVSLEIEI